MFKPDNPLTRLSLSLSDLCNLSAVKGSNEICPDHMPILSGIEAVRDRNAPANSPQTATKYNLIFPGSDYLRVSIKVDEPTPSVSQEALDKYGGTVRANIEGFSSGVFETNDGGARLYFKATKITPVVAK